MVEVSYSVECFGIRGFRVASDSFGTSLIGLGRITTFVSLKALSFLAGSTSDPVDSHN